MMRLIFYFFTSIFLIFFSNLDLVANAEFFDRSHTIFLPPQLSAKLEAHQTFPVFWWNFLVLEVDDVELATSYTGKICQFLATAQPRLLEKTACTQDLSQFSLILDDWARDLALRSQSSSISDLSRKLDSTLAKASLPIGPSLVNILRVDPLESYKDLQSQVEQRMSFKLKKVNGLFMDPISKRVVIPIQFNYPPNLTMKTLQFREQLKGICGEDKFCDKITLIGPHASTLENEEQVNRDVSIVSKAGTLLLILLALAAVASGRAKLLLLAPPVLVSTGAAILLTIGIFGSIHGLTLSFGTGIIGLAVDYSLHSVFNRKYRGIWRANLYGLLTTLVALVLMSFSSIPLLRQIMVFSSLGLTLGYIVFYFLHKLFPNGFVAKPLEINPQPSKLKFGIIFVLLLFSGVGLVTIKLNLDIRQFNFQTQKNAELSVWLFKNFDMKPPLLQIFDGSSSNSALGFAYEQRQWADRNHIKLENVTNYLPPEGEQKLNLESWSKLICSKKWGSFSLIQLKFFKPFFDHFSCHRLQTFTLESKSDIPPAYLKDFWGHGNWVSLWLPNNSQEIEKIKQKYPDSLSLREVVTVFPETLSKELRWMAPLSVLLATLLLAFYYRKWVPTLLSLIPFFSGLGLYFLASFLFHFNVTFITVIALVMVFGLSIDYGVFATDLAMGKKRSVSGVWSALFFSALATIVGFIPLLFCKHPVLSQLGQPLVFGTIGTCLGAIWGIPGFFQFLKATGVED